MFQADANTYIKYSVKYRKLFGTKFSLCDFFADIGTYNPFLKIIRSVFQQANVFKVFHKCPYKTVRFSDIFYPLDFFTIL